MGSLEEFYKKTGGNNMGSPAPRRLWIDVPPPSRVSLFSTTNKGRYNPPQPVIRPTATTLLRQNENLERQSKQEKEKIKGYTQGNLEFDQEAWRKREELENLKANQMQEAKRILRSKLAYHKAIAAQENIAQEKMSKAEDQRRQTQRLKEEAEMKRKKELERLRLHAAEIQEDHTQSKEIIEAALQQKRAEAQALKDEKDRILREAREKEYQEFLEKKEKIQKIQASKAALRAANTMSISGPSTNAFIGSLGSPDTEIRLKLSRQQEEDELEARKKKVQDIKRQREVKLEQVRLKIERQQQKTGSVRTYQQNFKAMPHFVHPTADLADSEISNLVKELQQYQEKRAHEEKKGKKN